MNNKMRFASITMLFLLHSFSKTAHANTDSMNLEQHPVYIALIGKFDEIRVLSCDQTLIRPADSSDATLHANKLSQLIDQLTLAEQVDLDLPIHMIFKTFPGLMPYEIEDYLIEFMLRYPQYRLNQNIFSRIDDDRGCKNEKSFLEKMKRLKALFVHKSIP